MLRHLPLILLLMILSACQPEAATTSEEDPFMWLEQVEGEEALSWVQAHNEATVSRLESTSGFDDLQDRFLGIYNSDERIPSPRLLGDQIYNFWQDDVHERGIWRRTAADTYLSESMEWETVLDLDELGRTEDENWVWKGASCFAPDNALCMVYLSRGGADATVSREFRLTDGEFVQDGFELPESKGSTGWVDANTLLVAQDFGEGSMTSSGYPRTVRRWSRGTSIDDAEVIFEGEDADVGSFSMTITDGNTRYSGVVRAVTFYTSESHIFHHGTLVRLPIPDDAQVQNIKHGQLLLELKSDWLLDGTTYAQGALISVELESFLDGSTDFQVVVAPEARASISQMQSTSSHLIVNRLENVRSALYRYGFDGSKWIGEQMHVPSNGTIGLGSSSDTEDSFFFTFTGFLTPSALYRVSGGDATPIKQLPEFFRAEGLMVEQFEAESKDGTMIPYFVVRPENLNFDGDNPTLLYAYGGFEISMQPSYSAITGSAWLEEGGVYVLANLRGGGEFGPAWHQAGLKANRQLIYDDFTAVAEDLIDRGISSPRRLGISGGSNGGLLVGVAFTQRPDLYNAVVSSVPLLDMKRYNKLLAGASWMGEYGDPDVPEEWEFISKYSPYHNLDADTHYPRVFFNTSTRDDRVHPGHARKMVARMEALGHTVDYWENTEGGHGAAVTNDQRAYRSALVFSYLARQLVGGDSAG